MNNSTGPRGLLNSAVFQAFCLAALAIFVLYQFEHSPYYGFAWTMTRGGGTTIAVAVFLGTLTYRLGQQYLAQQLRRAATRGSDVGPSDRS